MSRRVVDGSATTRTTEPVVRPERERAFRAAQRDRLQRYNHISAEHGENAARDQLLVGYPEIQRAKMGPLIDGVPLIVGFRQAVTMFAAIGIREEVIDISTEDTEAVLEIATTCMCRTAADDAGVEVRPVLCELDFEATRRAFPQMSVRAECRQADGAEVCVFRYSRPRPHPPGQSEGQGPHVQG